MNLFNGEKLGRKYIGLLTLFAGLFIAWIITNAIKSFGMFGTIADYLFKGYAAYCGANAVSKVPQFVKDIQKIQAERRKKNGLEKGSQMDQAGTPGSGRDSGNGPTGEGDDLYPEGGPGACDP